MVIILKTEAAGITVPVVCFSKYVFSQDKYGCERPRALHNLKLVEVSIFLIIFSITDIHLHINFR